MMGQRLLVIRRTTYSHNFQVPAHLGALATSSALNNDSQDNINPSECESGCTCDSEVKSKRIGTVERSKKNENVV